LSVAWQADTLAVGTLLLEGGGQVGVIERDPAGLVTRVPELLRLAQAHATLARAIERGKPHAVYRALFWLKLLGKTDRDSELVNQLLASRRLFIQPLEGAPTMLTYNGVGSRPYGNSEPDSSDGTYIMTLYLVVLFVPVYPLAAYLVRGASGEGWSFFGKVPLSSVGYVWQRALALAGVGAVAFGIFNAVGAARYNTVQVVNALPATVEVQVGAGGPVKVERGGVVGVRTKVGNQDVVVRLDGKELERGKLDVKRGFDVVAWNVMGAAPLFLETVSYSAEGSSSPPAPNSEPRFSCGERQVLQEDVDYAFRDAPESIKMDKHESVTRRSHFDLAKTPPVFCVFELNHRKELVKAQQLALDLAKVSDYDLETVARLTNWLAEKGDSARALAMSDEGRKRHDGELEQHRLYQSLALAAAQRAQVTEEYRARAKAHPESADAAYLLGRVLTGAEADQFVTSALQRFPRHPPLLRSAAYRALLREDHAAVVQAVETLRSVDPKAWQDSVSLELRALAATGKVDEARKVVDECLHSPGLDDGNRFEYAIAARLLSRFEPRVAPPDLDILNGQNKEHTATLRLTARVLSGEELDEKELRQLDNERLKTRLELEALTHRDPGAALAKVVRGDDASPGLDATSWALLSCEAARLDQHHPALERLLRWTPFGRAGAEALVDYVRTGKTSPELEDLAWEARAAADYVRSRSLPPNSPESEALRGRATRQDALRGAVTLAMNEWPP
jgi:hypothetical protein